MFELDFYVSFFVDTWSYLIQTYNFSLPYPDENWVIQLQQAIERIQHWIKDKQHDPQICLHRNMITKSFGCQSCLASENFNLKAIIEVLKIHFSKTKRRILIISQKRNEQSRSFLQNETKNLQSSFCLAHYLWMHWWNLWATKYFSRILPSLINFL